MTPFRFSFEICNKYLQGPRGILERNSPLRGRIREELKLLNLLNDMNQKEAYQRFLDSVLQCKIRTAEKAEAQNSGPALFVQRRKSVNLLE